MEGPSASGAALNARTGRCGDGDGPSGPAGPQLFKMLSSVSACCVTSHSETQWLEQKPFMVSPVCGSRRANAVYVVSWGPPSPGTSLGWGSAPYVLGVLFLVQRLGLKEQVDVGVASEDPSFLTGTTAESRGQSHRHGMIGNNLAVNHAQIPPAWHGSGVRRLLEQAGRKQLSSRLGTPVLDTPSWLGDKWARYRVAVGSQLRSTWSKRQHEWTCSYCITHSASIEHHCVPVPS